MTRKLIQRVTYLAGLAALAAIVSAGAARADTITVFSNFGPNHSFDSTGEYEVSGPGAVDYAIGLPFAAGSTADLTAAVLALGADQLGPNTPMSLDLESNDNGQPGSILATLTQQGTIPVNPSSGLVTFACASSCPELTSGTEYWLVAAQTDTDPNAVDYWYYSNTDVGDSAVSADGSTTGPWALGSDTPIGAFEVDGTTPATTPTVEPASFVLFGTGLIGLALAPRKRSRQQRAARAVQMVRSDPSPCSLTVPHGLATQHS